MARVTATVMVLAIAITCVRCGGGGRTTSSALSSGGPGGAPDPPTPVVVTPSGVGQVWQGTQVQFGANMPVTWSVREGVTGGTIDSNGLYTAPSAQGTFHIVATSKADPKSTGTAFVEVPPITVSIGPSGPLRIGGQRQFNGFVTAADQRVTWQLQEGAAAGTITPDGLYTAPNTPGTFHLIATSVFNPAVSSSAILKIVTTGFAGVGDMEIPRVGHTATYLVDGHVLVSGGTTDAAHSAELFDPSSSRFAPTRGAMGYVRSGHSATLLPDGKVLIAGGGSSPKDLVKTAELYDPVAQSFTPTGDLNQTRRGATATPLPNGKVLIAGGQDSTGALLSSSEVYDPNAGTFTRTGNMHVPRALHTATLLSSGRVLLVGSMKDTTTVELFDPNSGLYSVTGPLNQGRAQHTATLLRNGNVLVLGGTQVMAPGGGGAPAAPVSLASAEVYDVATGMFRPAGMLQVARDSHSATLLPNGTVLVAGGYSHAFDGDAQPGWITRADAELFDPARLVSTSAASLVSDRAEHLATVLSDGQILITGGIAGDFSPCCHPKPFIVTLASAETYK